MQNRWKLLGAAIMLLLLALPWCVAEGQIRSSLADLDVTRIWMNRTREGQWWMPIVPLRGESFFFMIGIANLGQVPANNFFIDYYYDNSHRIGGPYTIDEVSANCYWWGPFTATEGKHTIRVVVNQNRSVAESDFKNNEMSVSFSPEDASFSRARDCVVCHTRHRWLAKPTATNASSNHNPSHPNYDDSYWVSDSRYARTLN